MSNIDNDIDQDLLFDFLEESIEGIDVASSLFVQLEQNPENIEIIQAIFRPVHSIKGNSAFFNLIHTKKLAHSIENVLDLIRKEAMGINQTIINSLLEGVDEIKRILERVKSGEEEIVDENAFNELVVRLENLFKTEKETETDLWDYLLETLELGFPQSEVAVLLEKLAAFSPAGQQAILKRKQSRSNDDFDEQKKEITTDGEQEITNIDKAEIVKSANKIGSDKITANFMRVSEENVDKFLYYVGELITIGEMYSHFQSEFSSIPECAELRRINEMFHVLSSSLQKSLLDIRLLPMNTLFQKVPRIVRDIAVAGKKQIDVKITGENIHVDKSIIETLDSPLTHIIRNAADHGIETPEERSKNNKSPVGLLEINASLDGEDVVLTIKDNGKGFNFNGLKQKAKNMGLITGNEELSKKEIMSLIFQSGISTAQEVTDISGRGVGMDVVKRAIEEKKGTITVDSVEGQGSVFEIKMPMSVSTVIINGVVTSVENSNFIFPLEHVITSFSLSSENLVSVMEKGEIIKKDGEVFPIISLGKYFGLTSNKNMNTMAILVQKNENKIAVLVDEILGIKQSVLKSIELTLENKYIKGASIMGDGTIALVLDIDNFFKNHFGT